jgi:hypothetical protein
VALSSCSNAGESEKNKEPFNLKGDDMKVMFKSTETSCSRLKEGHDADLPKRAAKRRQSSSSSLHHEHLYQHCIISSIFSRTTV